MLPPQILDLPATAPPTAAPAALNRTAPALLRGVMRFWSEYNTGEWTFDALEAALRQERLGLNVRLGQREMKLALPELRQYFTAHWGASTDDEPLIVYDKCPPLAFRTKFPQPWVFPEDLFSILSEDQKPTSEVVVIEPYRGGLPVKRSRLSTDFWSALTEGKKLWILFPPSATPDILRCPTRTTSQNRGTPGGGNAWFFDVYLPSLLEHPHRFEFLQEAGDIVYVPHGWWFKWIALADKNVSLAKFLVDRANVRCVWRSMGGTLPEDLLGKSSQGDLCGSRDRLAEPPYKGEDSNTRRIDPLGLMIEVWPIWKQFLMHPSVCRRLHIEDRDEDSYWGYYAAHRPSDGKPLRTKGYGTAIC